jgi:predicted P-loop ATPase
MDRDIPDGWGVIEGDGGNDDGPPPPEDGDPGAWGEGAPPVSEPADDNWRDGLIVTAKGSPKLTFGNVLFTLRYHPALSGRIAYDSRRLHPVWVKPPPWCSECRPLEDKDAGELALWLQLDMQVGYSAKLCAEALLTESHQRPIDRVSDYLNGLQWDGYPRLDTWVSDYLGADQSAYIAAIGRAWCISAVARALQPGCKADSMLVLEGAQGVGKSSALRMLAGEDLFAELAIDVSDKDSWLAIHGPWIVEWSELAGFGRRESEAVKSFLSRQIDRMRPPYGRATSDFPRKVIFTGSTNETTYLGDPTGGRRYWPVRVLGVDLVGLESSRDQLWAEAVEAYHLGEPWWLDGVDETSRCSAMYAS